MGLRIACDLDGTVADMDAALQREARRLFGPDVNLHAVAGDRLESAEDVEAHLVPGDTLTAGSSAGSHVLSGAEAPQAPRQVEGRSLTSREVRQLWRHVAGIENFWMSLGEVEPGAVARLADMAVTHRWEVIFLTQRPPSAGTTTQRQSQQWLAAHGFELPSVMVMRGSRGKVADALALDAVLDDRPENCLDVVADSKARPILVWRLARNLMPPGMAGLGVDPVYSIAEALTILETMTHGRSRGGTIIGRLRRAFRQTP